MDAKEIFKWVLTIIQGLFILLILISLCLILAQAYMLKNAYEIGNGIQRECGEEFLESERGDYKVYTLYNKTVKPMLEASFKLLVAIAAVSLTVVVLLQIGYLISYDKKTPLFQSYAGIQLNQGQVYLRFLQFLIYLVIVAATTFIMVNLYKTLFNGKFNTGITLSPLIVTLNTDSDTTKMYIAQAFQLATAVGSAVIIWLLLRNKSNEFYNADNLAFTLFGILLAMTIVIPIISYVILKIRNPIDEYEQNYTQLSANTADVDVTTELKQNMYRTNKIYPNSLPADIKPYITHNVNYSDLQAIQIPDQLRELLHPNSLKGEAVLQLKRDLVAFYKDKLQIPYNLSNDTDLVKYASATDVTGSNDDDPHLYKIVNHFKSNIRDILLESDSSKLTQEKKPIKRNVFTVLNDTVITNPSYGNASPFGSDTLRMLQLMRESTLIKDNVNSIYKIVSGIIFTIIFVILYFLFHALYKKNPDYALQGAAGVILLLLLIGGAVGFFTKDVWL